MCMRYETAAILFHEEDGDFSLWTVDMPSEIVDEARKTADLHQESLLEIMELTPTVNGPTDTCLHFLFENEGQFSLCTMNRIRHSCGTISMREALSEGAEKISWKNSAIFSIVRRQRQKK